MDKLRHLDLFSGIGGFALGLERTGGFETVGFCEIEPFPQKVLRKHWPDVPIYEDVRTIDATGLGRIDCVTGGYPCQPFSTAGKRRGHKDDRHLWPAMFAVIQAARPTWIIGENVAGHISMGLDKVLSDLEGEGYACRPFVIPACAVDAPHRRDRVWVVAHAAGERRGKEGALGTRPEIWSAGSSSAPENVGNANGSGPHAGSQARVCCREESPGPRYAESKRRSDDVADYDGVAASRGSPRGSHGEIRSESDDKHACRRCRSARRVSDTRGATSWEFEPSVGRVAHGVPNRVDRLKGLGNAVVPQIPELIGRAILEAEGLVS